jgi:hypothetical protein
MENSSKVKLYELIKLNKIKEYNAIPYHYELLIN